MPFVLVYGGSGALGRTLVQSLRQHQPQWKIVSVDLRVNEEAHVNLVVSPQDAIDQQCQKEGVEKTIQAEGLRAIYCVAGGWAGGNASDPKFPLTAETMWKQSVQPSLVSAHLASRFLSPDGLLLLTGAKGAVGATPGMLGYGMCKAAVHHLCLSLAAKGSGVIARTICITPTVLDTPANRAAMPTSKTDTWIPMAPLADQLIGWASNAESCPYASGSLLEPQRASATTVSFEAISL